MRAISVLLAGLFVSISVLAAKLPPGQASLWRQPGAAVKRLDMFWGPGREDRRPAGPFEFVAENLSGTNPKIKVTDSKGVAWSVKFDEEVHSEVAATRLFWAAGYHVEEAYFVPSGRILGFGGMTRTGSWVDSKGRFKNARFVRKVSGPDIVSVKNYETDWKWDENPFLRTKEFSGLLLLNVLVANFDTKSSNNSVESIKYRDGKVVNWYMVSDLGGTFGRSDNSDYSKWRISEYRTEKFIRGVSSTSLRLAFNGKNSESFQSIPLEHARWICDMICGLEDAQLEDAFRAAMWHERVAPLPRSSNESLAKAYAAIVSKRLKQLAKAVGQ